MAHIYRALATISLDVGAGEPLTEAQIFAAALDWISKGRRRLVRSHGLKVLLTVDVRDEPVLSIDEPWCAAVVRRNSIDGALYACQMAIGVPEHGSVGDCPHPGGCDRPGEHHEYLSPGWDAALAAEAVHA